MNYKYYRDIKHNYLVVKNEKREASGSSYQLKIAESGRVKGLIPCDARNINGEQYLYYDIGSMQSLRDRYSARGMNRQQQIGLFADMKVMLEDLSEYLLGQDCIVFDIDSIFVDLATGTYRFMFCPFIEEAGNFTKLTEQLLDLTNSQDEEATLSIYNLCEYASETGAVLMEGIEKLLGEGEREPEKITPPKEDLAPMVTGDEDEEEEDDEEPASSGIKHAGKRLGGKVQLLMSGLFLMVVAALVYVRMEFILTKQENLLSIAVMAVSLVSGAICLVGGIRDMKDKKKETAKVKASDKEEEEDEDEDDDNEFEYSSKEYEARSFRRNYEDRSAEIFRTPLRLTSTTREETSQNATIALDMEEETNGEISLFSRNLDKTVRIGLEKLPLTIGKMEGCVDRVLKDMSVSRIHCRIFKDDESGKVAIMDLGSTNGTFKNGLRLSPREKNYIDEGDEVRIGRICFDCR